MTCSVEKGCLSWAPGISPGLFYAAVREGYKAGAFWVEQSSAGKKPQRPRGGGGVWRRRGPWPRRRQTNPGRQGPAAPGALGFGREAPCRRPPEAAGVSPTTGDRGEDGKMDRGMGLGRPGQSRGPEPMPLGRRAPSAEGHPSRARFLTRAFCTRMMAASNTRPTTSVRRPGTIMARPPAMRIRRSYQVQ